MSYTFRCVPIENQDAEPDFVVSHRENFEAARTEAIEEICEGYGCEPDEVLAEHVE